jgi:hypothetical protein
MRVLFIHEYLPQEMLGLMWLSRALVDAGHETRALFLPDARWLETVRTFAPDVVAYSVTTGMHLAFADLNRQRENGLAGRRSASSADLIPTFTPQFLETDGVDAICRGEGEQAFVELFDKLQAGEDHLGTENFWFKHRTSGEIVENPQRPLVRDLDAARLPRPRARLRRRRDLPRFAAQGLRDAARLPDELLLLLRRALAEEGPRREQRRLHAPALGHARARRDPGRARALRPRVRPLPRRRLQPGTARGSTSSASVIPSKSACRST